MYHTVNVPYVQPAQNGLSTQQVAGLAALAMVGTLVGYSATASYLATPNAVMHYTAAPSTQVRAPTHLQANPVEWAQEFAQHQPAVQKILEQLNGPAPIPEPIPEPQFVPEMSDLTVATGSLGSVFAMLSGVAIFAAAVYAAVGGKRKVAVAASAGFPVATEDEPLRSVTTKLASGPAASRASLALRAGPLDGLFDKRKTVIITGTSSGLGKQTARALCDSGEWYVIMAVRDPAKMRAVAKEMRLPENSYEVMDLELESLRSVRQFVKNVKAMGRQLDALVCNAALYLPNQRSPDFTEDGFERCFQVNHLSHFLMIRLLLDDIAKSAHKRIIVVGSITGNNNTVGGGAVYPLADLGKLQGMKAGMQQPISMIDNKAWNGAKAYKDSKVCNMMTIRELHRRYHKQLGITFSTMYPGCIAETSLFRQKRGWFRTLFPLFMKYVTGGYVSEEEAGDRLAECVDSEATKKSGVYWSWNGGARTVAYFAKNDRGEVALTGAGGSGGALFENEPSDLVRDPYTANEMYLLSEELLGLRSDARAKNAEPALP
jgi:protochlorophyllide reductase